MFFHTLPQIERGPFVCGDYPVITMFRYIFMFEKKAWTFLENSRSYDKKNKETRI